MGMESQRSANGIIFSSGNSFHWSRQKHFLQMKTSEKNIEKEIEIPVDKIITLKANLHVPADAQALVIFSHGSGSSRFSSRNRHVAGMLNNENIATLLTDLLTEEEDSIYNNRFDIDLLTERLMKVTNYMMELPEFRDLAVGFFGASTGAASALKAAAQLREGIGAVVSRGGRPDLAGDSLPEVKAPVLLLVGSLDTDVIILNEAAFSKIKSEKEMKIINGATHLFEEEGKLDEVASLAAGWFNKYLVLQNQR
jgi:dienelactone hydrolase